MAQYTDVSAPVKRYTRTDFTALRARLNRIPLERIVDIYYTEDELYDRGCESLADVARWLDEMRDHQIARTSLSNPHLSSILGDARSKNIWSSRLVDYLAIAPDRDVAMPRPEDAISVWLKPRVAKHLAAEGLVSLGDLKRAIEHRGKGWWRPVPRLGELKARAIERWLAKHPKYLGELRNLEERPAPKGVLIQIDHLNTPLPLERVQIASAALDGSQGLNRATNFSFIGANSDLEAVEAYLIRYADREKTRRAYQKELERFLLWCVMKAGVPLSGALVPECESYKAFLANPDPTWVGPKTLRYSPRWRPFASPLSPESQRYAVQVLRTFFDWLVSVRYLGGNPWTAVKDPLVAVQEKPLQIQKALPVALWEPLIAPDGLLDRACSGYSPLAAQYRLARAAILLMGLSGIRREETARATRDHFTEVAEDPEQWELAVLGKRNKWRTVFMPARVAEAVAAHWRDRGHDFSFGMTDMALLSPVVIPGTASARKKHNREDGGSPGKGFTADSLYRVVKRAMTRLADDPQVEMSETERELLRQAAPHALRHTFGTQAVADDVPLDVVKGQMGHAHLQTTSIYVQAERQRAISELGRRKKKPG